MTMQTTFDVQTMEHIQEQAVLKHCAAVAKEREPGGFYRLWNGTAWELFESKEPKDPPRQHTAYTLEDLAGELSVFSTERSVIFVGQQKVTAVLDADNRRATLTCPMIYTRDFTTLQKIEGVSYSQKELVNLLRIQLHGCVEQSLIGLFRNLKLQADSGTEANVQHGKEAIASSIKRQITANGADLPEEISVSTKVYDNLDLQPSTIRCAVILDMETLQFKLMPLNGQINEAQMDASRQIAEKLADLVDEPMRGRIFLGNP